MNGTLNESVKQKRMHNNNTLATIIYVIVALVVLALKIMREEK